MKGRRERVFSGEYTERGMKGADGLQAEFGIDEEQYLIKVPESIKDIGVLTEPMSVAAKAIDEVLVIQQARFTGIDDTGQDWLRGKKALVAGIGAIGLLAAFALRLRGAEVYGMDIVDEDSLRPRLLKEIGGTYIDGREVEINTLDDRLEVDFIFEATGIAKLQLQLIDMLSINSIYVATGITAKTRPLNRSE